jgi:AcrR family transcriptional regulator
MYGGFTTSYSWLSYKYHLCLYIYLHTKPTAQARSLEKQQRILAAMDGLLHKKSFSVISIGELAAESGVSPATIYQRFQNNDALGAVLLTLYFEKVQMWAQRPRGETSGAVTTGLTAQLRRVATDAWDQAQALGYVMRPAYLYSRRHPERTGEEWKRLAQVAREGFRAFVRDQAPELSPAMAPRAADTLCDLFNFMLLGPLLHDEDPRWHTPRARDDFADSLTALARGYLAAAI